MEETTGLVLARRRDPEKEKKIQFQNSWNRVGTRFCFR
jgi:hypothetical protein